MEEFEEKVKCSSCSGTGNIPSGGTTITCPICLGTGLEVTATVEGADKIEALSTKLDEMTDYLKKILEIVGNPKEVISPK